MKYIIAAWFANLSVMSTMKELTNPSAVWGHQGGVALALFSMALALFIASPRKEAR